MSELKKDSVERTLCIPLWSRAIAVKKLPQILPDHDAVRILKEMGETKPPTVLYNLELYACAPSFEAAMKKYKVDYEMIVGDGMFHCYPVVPICKEAKDGWNMMVRLIKNTK